jgi:hypothetical protein
LLDAWKARREHSLFILEHAEAIADIPSALALLGDMLATRPGKRVVLISSRVALPLRISHYLAPNQVLTLSRNELRFDSEEAASVFEGTDLATSAVNRLVRLADGWPTVLLLLALMAQYDAHVDSMADRLSRVDSTDLHEELAKEVLSAFTLDMMSTLLAMAAIPNASLADISAATGIRHATPIIDRLLHLPGFISSESGAYRVHPLVIGALRSCHEGEFAKYLFRAAQEYERSGEFLRAAELYTSYGDARAAARALDRVPSALFEQPSIRLIDALTKIDVPNLCAYPNLWIAALPWRRQNVAASRLYDEGVRLHAASDGAPSLPRLRVRLAILAQELEKLAEARALIESGSGPEAFLAAPEERRLLLMTSAVIAAKQGRFADADQFVDESDAVQGARHERFDAEREQIAMEKALLLGDWHGALKLSEEALSAAQRSGVISRMMSAARAVVRAAWYCNDAARATAASELLENWRDGATDTLARAPHVTQWHAALSTADASKADGLFDQAIDGIDTTESAFLQVMIRVSAALLLPVQRRRLLEARAIAQRIESPPLQASIELLIDSAAPTDFGTFRYIEARVARSPLKVRQDVLYVDVVRGQVRRGSELLHVSDRGLELLVALALLPAGTTKEELAGAIWPGLDAEAALNALKMCVSRTRVQVADRDVIQSTKRGYTLGERVATDVREFERLARSTRGLNVFSDPIRRQVQEVVGALGARERGYASGWRWFVPQTLHLDELQSELVLMLAKDAARHHDPTEAYQAAGT